MTLSMSQRVVNWLAGGYLMLLLVYLMARISIGDGFWVLSLVNTFAYLLFAPLPVLLGWALLTRSRLAVLRLLPVLLLAILWFAPRFLPRPTAAAAADGATLQVLTFNVWGNRHDLSSTAEWVRQSGVDIAFLQEISPAYATDGLSELADLYPYQSSQNDPTRWGGNFTLSKYPIVSSEYVDLGVANAPFPERLVLDVAGQPIAVYNVHLAWPVNKDRPGMEYATSLYMQVALGFDDRLRNAQIDGLLAHLADEPYPYIVAGDFNTSDFSVTYDRIAAQMRDSFRQAGTGLGGSWPVAQARGLPDFLPPLIRIDYIWHSAGIETVAAWQGAPAGSDHLPLFATLRLS